ncbi:nucleopolyhedrovirus P10 family protein [Streptomyces sp. NPDC048566]|uniref:nucleopolyhedrovirus P10 family protein n=1 Tax=Streptomyces sp. NPDC048566 TaxID=3365569 RepID=UPI003718DE4B
MTADRWAQAVRHQLRLGRLLPLGEARDGAWITEEAAESVLRRAAASVGGVRLGRLRIALVDPDGTDAPAVPAPPSALAPGPLRVAAECAVAADPGDVGAQALPVAADRLRRALSAAATHRLGLEVSEVDLRVTELLADPAPSGGSPAGDAPAGEGTAAAAGGPERPEAAEGPSGREDSGASEEARLAAAARAVPGVTRLTSALGRSVDIATPAETGPAVPRRHVRVEVAVQAEGRAVDVARAVRTAVAGAARDTPSVAVLVTAVG